MLAFIVQRLLQSVLVMVTVGLLCGEDSDGDAGEDDDGDDDDEGV